MSFPTMATQAMMLKATVPRVSQTAPRCRQALREEASMKHSKWLVKWQWSIHQKRSALSVGSWIAASPSSVPLHTSISTWTRRCFRMRLSPVSPSRDSNSIKSALGALAAQSVNDDCLNFFADLLYLHYSPACLPFSPFGSFYYGYFIFVFPTAWLAQRFPWGTTKYLGINIVCWGTALACSAINPHFVPFFILRILLGM